MNKRFLRVADFTPFLFFYITILYSCKVRCMSLVFQYIANYINILVKPCSCGECRQLYCSMTLNIFPTDNIIIKSIINFFAMVDQLMISLGKHKNLNSTLMMVSNPNEKMKTDNTKTWFHLYKNMQHIQYFEGL